MNAYFRYLPVSPAQQQWGLFLTDCGQTEILPGSDYPPTHHPAGYAFTWERGRTLDEYQLVAITRGRGTFEADGVRPQQIEAGDLFLLFPGVWHRYAPDRAIGWHEQWIGFNGHQADRIMAKPFFNPRKPVLHLGVAPLLRLRLEPFIESIAADPTGAPFSTGGRILEILGLLKELRPDHPAQARNVQRVRQAQAIILRQANRPIDFEALAREVGMSYTTFRRTFTEETHQSPVQFQLAIRLNHARHLLATTDLPVAAIAEETGFDSVFYFSRFFRQKTGKTPSVWRQNAKTTPGTPISTDETNTTPD